MPTVTIGAIRGGNPYHVTRTSELCWIYIDVRTVPGQDPLSIKRELVELLEEQGVPGEVELFVYRPSYYAADPGRMVEGLERAHRSVVGGKLEIAESPFSSMWRDILPFNELGIPAVTYGPGTAIRGGLALRIDDLYKAARVYAALAVDICTTSKPHPQAPPRHPASPSTHL